MVLVLVLAPGPQEEEERILSYLPLSHVAGLMVDIICPIVVTARTVCHACARQVLRITSPPPLPHSGCGCCPCT